VGVWKYPVVSIPSQAHSLAELQVQVQVQVQVQEQQPWPILECTWFTTQGYRPLPPSSIPLQHSWDDAS